MQLMGLAALMPVSSSIAPGEGHHICPYLLRNLPITGPDQVWCADITYLPLPRGWVYLVAIMDWWARYIVAWRLSTTLEAEFCCRCLTAALVNQHPRIFNTDQGRQFTSRQFTDLLHAKEILISMDGRGRYHDNIFIERFWRSLKYEDVYLRDYATIEELEEGVRWYIRFYNDKRGHQSLDRRTPAEMYFKRAA
jgi:putative transposase